MYWADGTLRGCFWFWAELVTHSRLFSLAEQMEQLGIFCYGDNFSDTWSCLLHTVTCFSVWGPQCACHVYKKKMTFVLKFWNMLWLCSIHTAWLLCGVTIFNLLQPTWIQVLSQILVKESLKVKHSPSSLNVKCVEIILIPRDLWNNMWGDITNLVLNLITFQARFSRILSPIQTSWIYCRIPY